MIKKLTALLLAAAFCILLCSCRAKKDYELPPDDGKTVICIDPGHGFNDVGCESASLGYEKDYNLMLSKMLKETFEEKGVTVILTHDGKSYPADSEIIADAAELGVDFDKSKMNDTEKFGVYERAIYGNVLDKKAGIDMFISMHINSVEDTSDASVSGASVDYYEGNPYRDLLAAFCEDFSARLREKELSSETRIYEDSFEKAYKVTKYATCPAVLIEAGYITNEDDVKNLADTKWQQNFCNEICDSVLFSLGVN